MAASYAQPRRRVRVPPEMQLATSLTGFRRVVLLAGVAAGIVVYRLWPAPEERVVDGVEVAPVATPTKAPALPDGYAGGCLPWIDTVTAHRPWSITIERGASGCTGSWVYDSLDVRSDGRVTWRQKGVPDRQLQLSTDELATIEHANHIDCVDNAELGYGRAWLRFARAGESAEDAGTTIPTDTQLGAIVDWTLEAAAMRYRTARLAALGSTQILLVAHSYDNKRYRVAVDDAGKVTVRRGSKTLYKTELSEDQRITLYDHLLGRVAVPAGVDEDVMVGRFVVGGVMLPVSLRRLGERWDFLWNAVESAQYMESER